MSSRNISFAVGELYHIVLRGADGILIFRDTKDYSRMIAGLFEYNNKIGVEQWRRLSRAKFQKEKIRLPRETIVDIIAFCLMPNHIHLLLKEKEKRGISSFMQKLGTGYAMYFNKKYQRSGHLFQSRFRAVHIKNEEQLLIVFAYIHTNPVALTFPYFKEKGMFDIQRSMQIIETYKWSSCSDYIGKVRYPSIIKKDIILKTIGKPSECKKVIRDWLESKKQPDIFAHLTLE